MSETLEERIAGVMWLALFMVLEPIKRVASALLYPLAYALRRQLRTGEVMRPDYLYRPPHSLQGALPLGAARPTEPE